MKSKYLLVPLLAITALSCEQSSDRKENRENKSANYGAENTGRNIRDRNSENLTSGDQSEDADDRRISANIRRAIQKDGTLSNDAKNVKIITNNGNVTLRGPVENEDEKNLIEEKANSIDGVARVDNQLEVK